MDNEDRIAERRYIGAEAVGMLAGLLQVSALPRAFRPQADSIVSRYRAASPAGDAVAAAAAVVTTNEIAKLPTQGLEAEARCNRGAASAAFFQRAPYIDPDDDGSLPRPRRPRECRECGHLGCDPRCPEWGYEQ